MTHEFWARFILAVGALLVVPLGLHVLRHPLLTWQRGVLLIAAGVLSVAQLLPPGPNAAALAAPWFAATIWIALLGLCRVWRFRFGPQSEFTVACGMVYLAIGGGWALADRAGIRPLNFDPAIVLLTGVHFHYAGFALPILTALAIGTPYQSDASAREDASAHRTGVSLADAAGWFIATGVVASVPLTAVGITATQLGFSPLVETAAAWCMSLSGLGVAWLHLRRAFCPMTPRFVRELWAFGGLFLACGMVLSILYGSRCLVPLPWLDIPRMRALHGTANSLGFTLSCLIGWCAVRRWAW